ncbi:LINE-1 retrotransposable element ORF1 protein [Dissostichus eleginoides]|uniref:LINE-1 retrotransposable element ORF1 protein n=1 Tax=Dissostichus eleginoides TaxID=100907 RepID=A0AAD9CKU0_DISEL|nr:LINE-1 retrotransposable element ORF1 protein [Dissostichus eleginoides]
MKQRPGSWPLKTPQEPRIAELEKQVSALTESLDMAENYSRRLNIQVVGLAEGTETGQPVDFFESDFSPAVMRKRKAYDAVKQRLRERGIPYAMLFPATLQVSHGGSKKKFSSPELVHDFLDSLSG